MFLNIFLKILSFPSKLTAGNYKIKEEKPIRMVHLLSADVAVILYFSFPVLQNFFCFFYRRQEGNFFVKRSLRFDGDHFFIKASVIKLNQFYCFYFENVHSV